MGEVKDEVDVPVKFTNWIFETIEKSILLQYSKVQNLYINITMIQILTV